jgi:hypothetical protein
MPVGLRRTVGVGTVALVVALAAPVGALAGSGGKCNASACKVYVEQGVPNAGGQQQPQQQQPQGKSTGTTKTSGKKTKASQKVSRVLANAGKDRLALSRLLRDSGRGVLEPSTGTIVAPSALGAAFDLGAGPAVLIAILIATAAGLAIQGGARNWRRRRPTA